MSKLMGCMVVAALVTTSARAEIITLDYTATVTQTLFENTETPERSVDRIFLPDGSAIARNQVVHGTFTIDTSTPMSFTPGTATRPAVGAGQFNGPASLVPGAGNAASLTVGDAGYTLARGRSDTPYTIDYLVVDGQRGGLTGDFFGAVLTSGDDMSEEQLGLELSQVNGALLSGTGIPGRFEFSALSSATLSYTFFQPLSSRIHEWRSFDATVTSLTQRVTPVPEASTYAMLGLGLLVVGAAARRRPARS